MEDSTQHFRIFAKSLEGVIDKFEDVNEPDLVERQRKQVNGLADLENQFRLELMKHKFCDIVYNVFFDFIIDFKKNILAARPYFRERQDVFTAGIRDAIRNRDVKAVCQYHTNFHFVKFALSVFHWGKFSKMAKIAKQIELAREELITINLPLVISRARIFWSRTPKGHLSFLDFVQIGVEGLMAGVDKYSGEYMDNWCGVAIGRITGNYIDSYSQTMLHFYPTDRRKLYRANKFLSRHQEGDFGIEEVVKHVNDNAGEKQTTNDEELANLIAAAGILSTDTRPVGDDENIPRSVTKFAAPAEEQPDFIVEHEEALGKMRCAITSLSIFDKKILELKGISIDSE